MRKTRYLGALILAVLTASFGVTQSAVPSTIPGGNSTTILTPLQQLGGDYATLHDTCCVNSGKPTQPTFQFINNADGSGNGYMAKNQIWGMDEGVSTESSSGRIYWFFGDTLSTFWDPTYSQNGIFAYFDNPTGSTNVCRANGVGGSYSTIAGICLGNDSMAFTDQASKYGTCEYIPSMEWWANNQPGGTMPYSTYYNNCPLVQFINESAGGMAAINSHVVPALPTDDSMLTGLTPNGAFTLQDPAGESLFLIYSVKALGGSSEIVCPNGTVLSQNTCGGTEYGTPAFITRSVLLKSTPGATIDATTPPTFAANLYDTSNNPIGTFSEVPTGTVSVTNYGTYATMTLCSGDAFSNSWSSGNWHIAINQASPYPGIQYNYFYGSSVPSTPGTNTGGYAYKKSNGDPVPYTGTASLSGSTFTLTPLNGNSLPPTSSCGYQYGAIPDEGTGPGRFMYTSMEVMSTSSMPSYIKSKLPTAWTQNSYQNLPATVVFFFGASTHYRASSLYLAVMDAKDVLNNPVSGSYPAHYVTGLSGGGQGVDKAYYLSGYTYSSSGPASDTVTWELGDETQAWPLIPLSGAWTNQGTGLGESGQPCIGEQSVRYQPNMSNLFLLTYGSWDCGGLYARTSVVPWGRWGSEYAIFANWPKYFVGSGAGTANPTFTFWYPQMIYENTTGFDSTMNAIGLAGDADESFNTDASLTNNALYCINLSPTWDLISICGGNDTTSPNKVANESFVSPYWDYVSGTKIVGNPYGAFQFPASTTTTTTSGGNSYATVYMNMSTFNPYRVWQTAVTFQVYP